MNLRNPAILILFASLFVIMVGFGIIIPVLPFFARDLGASPVDMGLLVTIFAFMQFICAPFWGTLSDRIGRKPVLLIGLFGHGLSFLLLGLADSLTLLLASRAIGGILSSASIPSALAYIADVTSDEHRGSGMGMLGASMGLGIIFGPAIGGLLVGISLSAPFYAAAAMSFATVIFAYLWLPESLQRARRVSNPQRGPQVRMILESVAGPIGFPLILTFVATFAVSNLEAMFAYWIQDKLGFGTTEMGTIFVAMGVTMAVFQGGIVGRLIHAVGDELVVRLGLLLTAAGFLLLLLATDMLNLVFFAAIWAAGGALLRPALSTIISKRAPGGQGAAMGLQGSFDSLGRIAGPVWGGYIYQLNISFPFLSAASLLLLCTLATLFGVLWRQPALGDRVGHAVPKQESKEDFEAKS